MVFLFTQRGAGGKRLFVRCAACDLYILAGTIYTPLFNDKREKTSYLNISNISLKSSLFVSLRSFRHNIVIADNNYFNYLAKIC